MKLVRTFALALGLTFSAGGVLAGSALADDGRDQRQWNDNDDHGRHDRDDDGQGRWDRDDRNDGGRQRDDGGGGWRDQGRDAVPVRFVNNRDQFVTLYLNGAYLGRIAPYSRERIALPCGNHVVTYQVGWRDRYHQINVSAFHGQHNRVVIEGRSNWGWNWGR